MTKKPTECAFCRKVQERSHWDAIDLLIYHKNGHVWPGFAGEPDNGNYGGSDFE